MNRRRFITGLGGILAAAAAPAIVRADSLMRVVPRELIVWPNGAFWGRSVPEMMAGAQAELNAYSCKIVEAFYKTAVFGELAVTEYEGEILKVERVPVVPIVPYDSRWDPDYADLA